MQQSGAQSRSRFMVSLKPHWVVAATLNKGNESTLLLSRPPLIHFKRGFGGGYNTVMSS